MSPPRTVPLLPCGSIDEAAEFGEAIGFEISYQQGPPHPYLALRSPEGIELHYFEVRDFDPTSSHGSCLVIVADPVEVLSTWSAGLDRLFGTVPVRGIPRLLRPTTRTSTDAFMGFSLVDVGGNRIRVVKDAVAQADAVPSIPLIGVVVTQPEPEPEPEPVTDPSPEPVAPLPPRPSAFERHGLAAAPQHRLSALVYLAQLAVRLGRLGDARAHLEAAEMLDPSAPSVMAVRAALEAAAPHVDDPRTSS